MIYSISLWNFTYRLTYLQNYDHVNKDAKGPQKIPKKMQAHKGKRRSGCLKQKFNWCQCKGKDAGGSDISWVRKNIVAPLILILYTLIHGMGSWKSVIIKVWVQNVPHAGYFYTFPDHDLLSFSHDESHFAPSLEISVEDKIKWGKPPRRNCYLHYCNWVHALLVCIVFSFHILTLWAMA